MLALGFFAATAGLLLPRLLAVDPTGSSSTPVPGPSASGEVSEAAPAVFFPTQAREANAYPDAGTSGTLIEDQGCVLLRQGDGNVVMVIWPHGWSVERAADGVLRILDDTGAPVAEVGENVELHGGSLGQYPQGPPERFPEEVIGRRIPARCTADDYFLTSGQLL